MAPTLPALSQEDRILAQLERSLAMMEMDYARTLASESQEDHHAETVMNGNGNVQHNSENSDEDGHCSSNSDCEEIPEGYQSLGAGGIPDDSDSENELEEQDLSVNGNPNGNDEPGSGDSQGNVEAGVEMSAEEVDQIKGIMSGIQIAPPEWAVNLDANTLQEQLEILLQSRKQGPR